MRHGLGSLIYRAVCAVLRAFETAPLPVIRTAGSGPDPVVFRSNGSVEHIKPLRTGVRRRGSHSWRAPI